MGLRPRHHDSARLIADALETRISPVTETQVDEVLELRHR